MRKRITGRMLILTALAIVITAAFASAEADDRYAPRIYESWDSARGNMLTNFWDGVNFFSSGKLDPNEDADTYGWYKGTFFGLAGWEKEICLADLSTDVRNVRDVVSNSEGETEVYTTTITASAVKSLGWNTSLYEASWYVASYGEGEQGLRYRLYLEGDKGSEFIKGKAGNESGAFESAGRSSSGYEVRYLLGKFDRIVLEYKFGDTGAAQVFEAPVVERNETGQ